MMIIFILALLVCSLALSTAEMDKNLSDYVKNQSLMGLALQITKSSQTIYRGNFGYRDFERKLLVDNSTCFRMASLSKNVAATGLYQMVQQNKLSLSDSLSSLLGFNITNPFYPNITITLEMLLSHQSSIKDCDEFYLLFLNDTNASQNVNELPKIKDLFTPGTKYYNTCSFFNKTPGTYYSYSNLGYVLVGNILEKITNTRFDIWMTNNYLKNIGSPSYNPATLPNLNNLAVLYAGQEGNWYSTLDDLKGVYKQKNLTGYIPGTNAAVYGPHAHLRATTDQILKHINLVREKTKGGLKQQSWKQMVRPRYQYHGQAHGQYADWHYYGLGLYTTGYYPNDKVLSHNVTVGHTGSGYGLISGMYYTGNYSFAYAINGILNGYTYNSSETIYQLQRRDIHKHIESFINSYY